VRIGVLALQGDVREHASLLEGLGVEPVRITVPDDLDGINGLVLPGGESTTISMLLDSSGLRPELAKWINDDRPTLGTCAGLVLLAETVLDGRVDQESLGGLDVTVRRNGYGRQKFSFEANVEAPTLGPHFDAVFIRAPRIVDVGEGVEVLARLGAEGEAVVVAQGSRIGCAFHPELSGDARLHERLVNLARSAR